MRYTYFEIENFKGIRHLRLDLDTPPKSRIHTLVGLNESGKTTILEAIDYYSKGNEDLGPEELAGRLRPDEHDLIPIANRANFNGTTTVQAGIELESDDIRILKRSLLRQHQYRLNNINRQITVTDRYRFSNSAFLSHSVGWNLGAIGRTTRARIDRSLGDHREAWSAATTLLTSRMPSIWYFPNFLFEFPRRIYLTDSPADTDSALFYRALVQDILDALGSDVTVDEHILQRAESGNEYDQRALNQLLLEMGRQVTRDVFTAWNRIFNRNIEKRVNLNIDHDETLGWYIEFQIEDADGYFFVHERSLGFRWFFVFLLLTTYRGFRIGSPRNLVYLFDEPASNLHASAQAELLNSLERLADKCVIIYTTHSHHLINPSWLENTHVVRNIGVEVGADVTEYHARKTDIKVERYRTFVSQYPDQSNYFQPILDKLDYAPSRLELVPELIMAEGKNDFYALRYMHDIILKREFELSFLPGSGAGSLDDVIRLYTGWARNFIVLLDSDEEGKAQQKRYETLFGPIVDGRILTLDDLVPSLAKKSLDRAFESEDRTAIQDIVYPGEAYAKKKFFRALQESLATRTSLTLTDLTTSRFSQLLDGLKARLEALSEHAPDKTS